MFNFSANNLYLVSSLHYEKFNILVMKDGCTNRCYRIYDFAKVATPQISKPYCVSGKVNSADKIYLVLEEIKDDKKTWLTSIRLIHNKISFKDAVKKFYTNFYRPRKQAISFWAYLDKNIYVM